MPTWLAIAVGLTIGFAVIAGAIYLVIRPYLRPNHKPWLPPPREGAITSHDYATPEVNGHHGFDGGHS